MRSGQAVRVGGCIRAGFVGFGTLIRPGNPACGPICDSTYCHYLMNKSETSARRETGGLHFAVLMVLASAIGYGGYQFYSTQKQVIESGLHRQLVEIAAAKVSQVSVWRQERMGDAALAAVEARLMPDVQQVLHSRGTPEARRRTLEWMEALRSNYRYANIVLLNSDGKSLLTTGERLGTEDLYAEMVRESARAPNGWVFREYHSDPRVVRPHFVLGVRLRTDTGETSGVMLMGIDPQVTVYPSIMKWPTDSRTGEVFLVRRDGDRVLILSDLRRGPEAAMQLEGLGTKTLSPAVRAVVSQGIARGVDKSGVEVIATALRVPGDGKDWFVVSQIHAEEAYQPVRDLRMMVLLVSVLLFLACAAGVGLIWRHQVSMSYQQRYESEQERRALLGHYDYLSREINWLSAARLFLFAARDVWFVVGLPVFLSQLGWSSYAVGAFLALWVIGYGFIQATVPEILRLAGGRNGIDGTAARHWASVLVLVPLGLIGALWFGADRATALMIGLAIFAVVFAINSAVHSYLVLMYTDADSVAVNVGFYYMANAGGRLLGTLLSGMIFQLAGFGGCLWGSVTLVAAAALLSFKLPRGHAISIGALPAGSGGE